MNPWVSFGLRIGAVISVLASAMFESLPLGLAPVGLIFLYATLVWTMNRENPSRIEALADQAYFLGYLSTIAAFAGVVLSMLVRKRFDDPNKILLMIAVALLATVAGLLAMTSLKDFAARRRQMLGGSELHWEDEVLKRLEKIAALTGLSGSTAEQSTGGAGTATHLVSVTNKTAELIEQLNVQLERLKTNINSFDNLASKGAGSAKVFSEGVQELQQVLQAFVNLVGTLFPRSERESERI